MKPRTRLHPWTTRALGAAGVLFLSVPACAQFTDLPCRYYRPGGGLSGSGSGGLLGGGAFGGGIMSTEVPPADEAPGTDARYELSLEGEWKFALSRAVFTFDEYEGKDLGDYGVDDFDASVTAFDLVYLFGRPAMEGEPETTKRVKETERRKRDLRRSSVDLQIPYVDFDLRSTSGDLSASGLGDIVAHGYWSFTRLGGWGSKSDGDSVRVVEVPEPGRQPVRVIVAKRKSRGWGADLWASLPTGDEDELLGHGDPTFYAGAVWWTELGSQEKLENELALRLGYLYNDHVPDHSVLVLKAGWFLGWDRVALDLAATASWETHGDVEEHGGMTRDAAEEYEISADAGFYLGEEKRWLLAAGLLAPLDDDLLNDNLTFRLGVTYTAGGAIQ